MRIKGDLIKIFAIGGVPGTKEQQAEIELAPVDLSKVKNNDYILVKCRVLNTKEDNFLVESGKNVFMPIDIKNIVAHIPQSEEPKKVELPEKWSNAQIKDNDCYGDLGDVMITQNQLIDYLRELKEKEVK